MFTLRRSTLRAGWILMLSADQASSVTLTTRDEFSMAGASGMYIPICPISVIGGARPDGFLIMPWKLKNETVGNVFSLRVEVARW
jgi:uncharacterized 2Fe-2S/4Fe-4S cluster protein (DUF4445 family)